MGGQAGDSTGGSMGAETGGAGGTLVSLTTKDSTLEPYVSAWLGRVLVLEIEVCSSTSAPPSTATQCWAFKDDCQRVTTPVVGTTLDVSTTESCRLSQSTGGGNKRFTVWLGNGGYRLFDGDTLPGPNENTWDFKQACSLNGKKLTTSVQVVNDLPPACIESDSP
jgi:hypothetical protein